MSLAIELKKAKIYVNEPLKLGLSNLELVKIVIYEFSWHCRWCRNKVDTSNRDLDRPLLKQKKQKSKWINKRLIRLKNHEKICWIKSKNV